MSDSMFATRPNFKGAMLAFAASMGYKQIPTDFVENYENTPQEDFDRFELAIKQMNETGEIDWAMYEEMKVLLDTMGGLRRDQWGKDSNHPEIHDPNQG